MKAVFQKFYAIVFIAATLLSFLSASNTYADDIEAVLDSTDGTSAFSIKDSGSKNVMDVTSDGVVTLSGTNGAGSSFDVLTLSGTVRALSNDTFRSLVFTYNTLTGNTGASALVVVDISTITDRSNLAITAIRIGSVSNSTESNDTAIAIGTGWDNVLTVNGVDIISGAGTIMSTGGGDFGNVQIAVTDNQTVDTSSGDLILDANGDDVNVNARMTVAQTLTTSSNISIGSNGIITSSSTIDASELDLLDGRDTLLVDINDAPTWTGVHTFSSTVSAVTL